MPPLPPDRPIASAVDDFSYAAPDDPFLRRALIAAIERLTGQPTLKRLYLENRAQPVPGETFWNAAIRKLRLDVRVNEAGIAGIPADGPLVVVANHPFGVLDGIVMCHLIARRRMDFLVLTNALLYRAEEIRPFLLPVDFTENRAALETNIRTRAQAKAHLSAGGCVVVFPAGGVSTVRSPLSRRAEDAPWGPFTAKLIQGAKAPVVPVYFAGQNSRLFQIASHVSMTLRLSLLFKEVRERMDGDVQVQVGAPIAFETLASIGDRTALMAHLRARVYALAAELEAERGPVTLRGRARRRGRQA